MKKLSKQQSRLRLDDLDTTAIVPLTTLDLRAVTGGNHLTMDYIARQCTSDLDICRTD